MPFPRRLQLILLAALCALLTLILGAIAIIDTIRGHPVALPASLTAFAGVAYTALFGHGVFTQAQESQSSQQSQFLGLVETLQRPNGGETPAAVQPSSTGSPPAPMILHTGGTD